MRVPWEASGGPTLAMSASTVVSSVMKLKSATPVGPDGAIGHRQFDERRIARALLARRRRSALCAANNSSENEQCGFHAGHPEKVKLMNDRCVSPGRRMLLGKLA